MVKNMRFLTLSLSVLFLVSACEYTDDDPTLEAVKAEGALAVFSDEYDSVDKISLNGEVETIVLTDSDGNEFDIDSAFPRMGRSDLVVMDVNYYTYAIHRPSGKAIRIDSFTSLDGHMDTGFYLNYSDLYDYENNDIQSSRDHYAFRITNNQNNTVELQSAHFDEDGLFVSSPVPDSKHTAHFMLSDTGVLAFTTLDIKGSGECATHITSAAGNDQLEPQPSTFYWVGSSGSLYFLKAGETESSPSEIHRVSVDGGLSTEIVGYEMDEVKGPCDRDIRLIGSIDKKTYFRRSWYNDIIEFDEETLELRELETRPSRGLVGAGTAGDYIYFWGGYNSDSETDFQWVEALDQFDPSSEVTTRIYEGDPILVGYIDDDTLWAKMSTPGLHNWIGKIDGLSTLTGMTPMTEVYRPQGTFDGGQPFNYIWLGR